MPFLQRLRAVGRMLLMLFILASAAFLSAVTAMRFAIEGRQVKMPALVGQKMPDAEKTLSANGLSLRVEDRVYSDFPEDVIVRQSPPAGLKVKTGERTHVVLSLGPQHVLIPDLRNASVRATRIQLLRDGLQLGETSSAYIAGSPGDTVILQNPPAGATNVTSPHVDLLISLSDPPHGWVMPDVTGIAQGQAAERLAEAGLKNVKIEPVAKTASAPPPGAASTSGAGASGANMPANPVAGGAGSPAGAATSTLFPGLPTTATPNQQAAQAPGVAPLTAPAAGPASGTVLAQTPSPGAYVAADTQIELRVAR